jgi:hypothetical protein
MEDNSATALFARLRNSGYVARSEAELRAHIEAAIEMARVPWERGNAPRLDVACDDDDDELVVEPVPVPASAPSRRQRKRSLAKVCEAARKAGANHVIVVLSPSAAVPETDANEWDAVLLEIDHAH